MRRSCTGHWGPIACLEVGGLKDKFGFCTDFRLAYLQPHVSAGTLLSVSQTLNSTATTKVREGNAGNMRISLPHSTRNSVFKFLSDTRESGHPLTIVLRNGPE